MRHSVLRRSGLVLGLFVIGLTLCYTLLAVANRNLAAQEFGLFYIAWTLINVASTPGAVVTTFLAAAFARLNAHGGAAMVVGGYRVVEKQAWRWGLVVAALAIVSMYVGARIINAQPIAVIILVPLITLGIFWLETVRAALQGMLSFVKSGLGWITYHLLDLIICGGALMAFGTVASGLMGMLLATFLAAILMRIVLCAGITADNAHPDMPALATIRQSVRDIVGVSVFAVVANADILIAYLALPPGQLGVYTASAMLPKAVVSLTQPVAQVALALTAGRQDGAGQVMVLVKSLLAVAVVTTGAWGAIVIGVPILTQYGLEIRHLDYSILSALAAAAVPVSLFRIMLLVDLARARWQMFLIEFIFSATFFVVVMLRPLDNASLADSFSWFAWLLFSAAVAIYGARAIILAVSKKGSAVDDSA